MTRDEALETACLLLDTPEEVLEACEAFDRGEEPFPQPYEPFTKEEDYGSQF